MVPPRTLHTERLRLEPLAPAHAKSVWAATRASLPQLRPWMRWARDATLESTRVFARSSQAAWQSGQAHEFALFEGDAAIGTLGVHMPSPLQRMGEVGYWLRSDRAGRGLMSEAVGALVVFAFNEAGLHRLEVRAGVGNGASRRVAEKNRFRLEGGPLREAAWGADGPYDCMLYGRLVSD